MRYALELDATMVDLIRAKLLDATCREAYPTIAEIDRQVLRQNQTRQVYMNEALAAKRRQDAALSGKGRRKKSGLAAVGGAGGPNGGSNRPANNP